MKQFDALFLREFANENFVIFLDYHIAVKTLNDHSFLSFDVNDSVV